MNMLDLLDRAHAAGLRLSLNDAGKLHVDGPRRAEPIALELIAQAAQLADWLVSGRAVLNWTAAVALLHPAPCADCGRPARLVDPADNTPRHKVCAEGRLETALGRLTATTAKAGAA